VRRRPSSGSAASCSPITKRSSDRCGTASRRPWPRTSPGARGRWRPAA
jgi:hypothetical protein